MNEHWKVRARNVHTGKWQTIATGSREHCERVYAVEHRSTQYPYDRVVLMPGSSPEPLSQSGEPAND